MYVIRKEIHLEVTREVWGAITPEAEEIKKKKTKKMEAFPLFFFCFLAGLPRSPKL